MLATFVMADQSKYIFACVVCKLWRENQVRRWRQANLYMPTLFLMSSTLIVLCYICSGMLDVQQIRMFLFVHCHII